MCSAGRDQVLKLYVTYIDDSVHDIECDSNAYEIKDNMLIFDGIYGKIGFNIHYVKSFKFAEYNLESAVDMLKSSITTMDVPLINLRKDNQKDHYCKCNDPKAKDDYRFANGKWWKAVSIEEMPDSIKNDIHDW